MVNIVADLPKSLNPYSNLRQTGQPIGPADLAPPIFPMEVIKQEVSERYITIPEEVQEIYCSTGPARLFGRAA